MSSNYSSNALPVHYKLGEYLIESVLGHGGFGITYLAKDIRLDSLVAIKEYFPNAFAVRSKQSTIRPRAGGDTGDIENYRWGLQEFLKEARALAKFKHNHIVRVLRFLEGNGTAYMVMEYEEGESLARYLKRAGGFLNEPMLLQVFLPILNGLQAVHGAGLLHLDIKPDNIYLRRDGQPMLIDFGSAQKAKRSDDADQRVALTPGYSSLEQYPGHGTPGPWSDVYAIGATLYRCVTGKEPADVMKRVEALDQRGIDLLTPATEIERPYYSKHIRECIDKAMEIKQDDRPQSAAALQKGLMGKPMTENDNVSRYRLNSGFIGVVRKASTTGHLKKYIKRSFLEKLFVFLVFLATMAIVIPKLMVDTFYISEADLYNEIDELKLKAETLSDETRRYIDKQIFGVHHEEPTAQDSIAAAKPGSVREQEIVADKVFTPSKSVANVLEGHLQPVTGLVFVANDTRLISASHDGEIKIWDLAAGELVESFQSSPQTEGVIAASHDGRWLAVPGDEYIIRLLDVKDKTQTFDLLGHSQRISTLAFSPDGKLLVSAGEDRKVTLWDVEKRQRVGDLIMDSDTVLALAFSPNGRMLVAGDKEGGIRYWDMTARKELAYTSAGDDAVTSLAFSSDGDWLASGGEQSHLKLWYIGIKRNDRSFLGAPETVHSLQFSPDDKWLILGGSTATIQVWDVKSGTVAYQWTGHDSDVQTLALSADGSTIASGSKDHTVRIWK